MAILAAVASPRSYNGVENAVKRIFRSVDGSVPSGDNWHNALLKQASTKLSTRPSVISETLRLNLMPYLTFRHFFRHAYGFDME